MDETRRPRALGVGAARHVAGVVDRDGHLRVRLAWSSSGRARAEPARRGSRARSCCDPSRRGHLVVSERCCDHAELERASRWSVRQRSPHQRWRAPGRGRSARRSRSLDALVLGAASAGVPIPRRSRGLAPRSGSACAYCAEDALRAMPNSHGAPDSSARSSPRRRPSQACATGSAVTVERRGLRAGLPRSHGVQPDGAALVELAERERLPPRGVEDSASVRVGGSSPAERVRSPDSARCRDHAHGGPTRLEAYRAPRGSGQRRRDARRASCARRPGGRRAWAAAISSGGSSRTPW